MARGDRRRPPPPDLPSLLFDQRIVYLGMPLVPAVTELMVAELLYLEKQGQSLPIEMLINSSGTTRQDGEILAFDSEGIAITSVMGFVKNPISTVNMGLAVGWSAVVLGYGRKGLRKSLPHSLAMLQQPRVPPTGQRQAVEVHIKWREVLDYKRELLRCLSLVTGWGVDKLDADMQRPLYMRPQDALEYGLIDEVIAPNAGKAEKAAAYWLKSGRAEGDGRLEQWQEYLELQEKYSMQDQFRKVRAQELRSCYREAAKNIRSASSSFSSDMERVRSIFPQQALADGGSSVDLPFTPEGLKMAILNSETYADRQVKRQMSSKRVKLPSSWEAEFAKHPTDSQQEPHVDYKSLVKAVEAMGPEEFSKLDLDKLLAQYSS